MTAARSDARMRVGAMLAAMAGLVAFAAAGGPAVATAEGQQEAASTDTHRAMLDRYCAGCHNDRLQTANLSFDSLDLNDIAANPPIWERVIRKLRMGSMPPPPRPRPDVDAYRSFIAYLETSVDTAAAALPMPGRPAPHRLNRTEYANAVRDLLGVTVDPRAMLPADDSGYGFDNVADVLSISPGLLDRYLIAANRIGRLAVGDPTLTPVTEAYHVSPYLAQDTRMGDDLPFGSRGGLAVHHHFPVDGQYVIAARLRRTSSDRIRGLARPNTFDIRLDGALVHSVEIGGDPDAAPSASEYGRTSDYLRTADDALQIRLRVAAGRRLVSAAFVNDPRLREGLWIPRPPVGTFEESGIMDTAPAVERLEVRGPYDGATPADTESRRKIFVCYPAQPSEEEACAARIVRTLARRAYRRPAADAEVEALLALYREGRAEGGFDIGIEWVIERLLVSPAFLFRAPVDPVDMRAGAPYRIDDLELASRLSFFLWSSIPDDELLDPAERGELHEPAVLDRQVRRMLRDPRAASLVTNFAGQWLWQRNLLIHTPDRERFTDFDDNLRAALETETRLFLESQIREDRPVPELLTADYTFMNERLARHYGVPDIYGSHFRRVPVTGRRLGGLLGHGSILTVTSYPHRTSPVVRGKWLLENIFGAPPPPPPPNVPALEEAGDGAAPTSVRERLEAHRRNPVCASCHAPMDPLGFALENFDATGRWRDLGEGGAPVDASGLMPDGTPFDGPAQFRDALAARGDLLVRTLAEKLLTYALGRGLEYYDMPAVREAVRAAENDGYRWSALVSAIARSVPFRMRAAADAAGDPGTSR